MRRFSGAMTLVLMLAAFTSAASWAIEGGVEYAGKEGPGKGKHIVFLTGDEEYRGEEGMPMLARILSERHGFKCTVLFAMDDTGNINPDKTDSLPGAAAIESADAIVLALRFRNWPDDKMAFFVKAFLAGKPIIGLRTSTHAFNIGGNSAYKKYGWGSQEDWKGGFGKHVLGESWVSHWGAHKSQATRGVIEDANKDDVLLRGVKDVFGDTDVYEAYPPADAKILLRGQVLKGMNPTDAPADYKKKRATDGVEQGVNEPMQAIAWTRLFKNEAGKENKILCTTMGSATDLQSEGLRRLLVNAVYWGVGLEVPASADVTYVGKFTPTMYGFGSYKKNVKPEDHSLENATKPPRSMLPPSKLPLELTKNERVALVGNSLAERMNLFGHFETLLHARFPQLQLIVRNFGRPADEVGVRQRSNDYTKLDDPLAVFAADTFVCFFGYNESFAGAAGLDKFKADYENFLNEYTQKYNRDGNPPRFVLVSPTAFEAPNNPLLPAGPKENENLKLYAAAIKEIAAKRELAFVDVYSGTEALFLAEAGLQYTINGVHVNEAGDREVGLLLDRTLFGTSNPMQPAAPQFQKMRAAVNDKSWVHAQDYRMINGWYVYGGRRTYDHETFPREYKKIRNMAAARDRYIWDMSAGKAVPEKPDDIGTGDLIVPQTAFGTKTYSEPKELRYLTPEEDIASFVVPDGFEVKLFASEREFPELAKPVQTAFDNKGRLWVSCMPTYPQWRPGDAPPNDKLLIFEDTDGDGKADKCKTFYDKLHCPTGFEFWNGGVLVVDQPRILFLKDTNGDDKADEVVHWMDGWATDDTHHTAGAFEYSHGGLLHMLEGVAMSTTLETPWGALRNHGSAGAWIVDPRTLKIRRYTTPGYGNPWCYVFNAWGQGIVGDGTTAQQHWDSPLSGAQFGGRRSLNTIFNNEGMRPVIGSEFLYSRHFPDDVQGQFIYACVINMNGLTRFEIKDDGAGYSGKRIPDLLKSTDKNFRPADPQLGPDGALWFGDWANALIGHMQYSQRDPNRDHTHGRVYRLVAKGRPLLKPVTQFGKSPTELLEQLKEYETRTRYAARRELRDRPTQEVLAAIKAWVAKLDPNDKEYDRLLMEALWAQQGHHAVDVELLKKVLHVNTYEARAAATHLLADEWEFIPNALELLKPQVADDHGRVRVEAVRALSFVPTVEAVELALEAAKKPMDYWLEYTLEATLGALQPVWRPAFDKKQLAANNEKGLKFAADYLATIGPGGAAVKPLRVLLSDAPEAQRTKALEELAKLSGNAERGHATYSRTCMACHKIGKEGVEFGPELTDVGKRLNKMDLIMSIVDPNAKVDPKWTTTNIETTEAAAITGFVLAEDKDSVTMRVAGGTDQKIPKTSIRKRNTLKISSMPEGLAGSIAPQEFLDLIEFLATRK